MPPLTIPPELKKITSYIRRAEELDRAAQTNPESRLVAYYLRQYAVQQGIPLASSSAAAKTCLTDILTTLEGEKQAMDNFTPQEAAFLCRAFAQKVFDKADFEDREGMANKETARTFYAAATFLQILEQFETKTTSSSSTEEGGDDEDVTAANDDRKRILYAKWKATEILKALKEGRTPTPGGYGEEEPPLDEEEKDSTTVEQAPPPASVSSISSAPPPLDISKMDAPVVAPVKDDDADEEIIMPPPHPETEKTTASTPVPKPMPSPPPSSPPPPSEEGTEVGLDGKSINSDDNNLPPPPAPKDDPPPPAYPGPQTGRTRPSVNFNIHNNNNLPPPMPPPAAAPAPVVAAPTTKPSGGRGWFGGGGGRRGGNSHKLTKAQWADATELTQFALAALQDKNADVAIERLEQALQALGR